MSHYEPFWQPESLADGLRAALEKRLFVFGGVGAVGRPCAEFLASAGMRRCLLVDNKAYKPASVVTQCEPEEVGLGKAAQVAARLKQRWGVDALAMDRDIGDLEPGYIESGTIWIQSCDNRRADILANRLGSWMGLANHLGGARGGVVMVKANVEPTYLLGSLRCVDFSRPDVACVECSMTDQQYEDQLHPESCDGSEGRPTNSPRALCQLTAGVAALAAGQIAAGAGQAWLNRLWQVSLLSGQAQWTEIPRNPDCRWDHQPRWLNFRWLKEEPGEITLKELAAEAGFPFGGELVVDFSGQVGTRWRCQNCGQTMEQQRWLTGLLNGVPGCPCGGDVVALPFYVYSQLPASKLAAVWDWPLSKWAVPSKAIIALAYADKPSVSFVVGSRDQLRP